MDSVLLIRHIVASSESCYAVPVIGTPLVYAHSLSGGLMDRAHVLIHVLRELACECAELGIFPYCKAGQANHA